MIYQIKSGHLLIWIKTCVSSDLIISYIRKKTGRENVKKESWNVLPTMTPDSEDLLFPLYWNFSGKITERKLSPGVT